MQTKNTKQAIMDATVSLVANGGVGAATVRAIARQVGVTEGAVYRHYESKDALIWHAYATIVEEMAAAKRHLLEVDWPFRQRVHEWVRLTYDYYDRQPEAFTYVLLTPHDPPEAEREAALSQGRLFMELFRESAARGELRELKPEVALSHFTGIMLNVPRLINDGVLAGPAQQYVDEAVDAVWRVLAAER